MINFNEENKLNEEVYSSRNTIISIDNNDVSYLIELAKKTVRNRVRFCSHGSSEDIVHEMFIVHPKNAYVRPHKHLSKSESMIVIDGEVDYVIFNNDGSVKKIIPMGDYKSGKCFYQSIRNEEYHSMIIKSEWLVFLEITKGPFKREDLDFASFAPEDNDLESIDEYMNKIREQYE